jgi:hypothetical protein
VRVRPLLPAAVAIALCAGGCTSFSARPEPAPREPRGAVSTSAPDDRLTGSARR